MAEYDNTNRGTIGKNTRKSKDTDSDLSGQINVNGVDYWLNGWKKQSSKDGSTFYSLSVKPKESRQEQRTETPPARGYGEKSNRQDPVFNPPALDDDDTIPF